MLPEGSILRLECPCQICAPPPPPLISRLLVDSFLWLSLPSLIILSFTAFTPLFITLPFIFIFLFIGLVTFLLRYYSSPRWTQSPSKTSQSKVLPSDLPDATLVLPVSRECLLPLRSDFPIPSSWRKTPKEHPVLPNKRTSSTATPLMSLDLPLFLQPSCQPILLYRTTLRLACVDTSKTYM